MKLPGLHMVPETTSYIVNDGSLDIMGQMVYEAVNGRNTISQISEFSGLEPELTQRIVLNLLDACLVTVPGFEPKPLVSTDPGPKKNPGSNKEVKPETTGGFAAEVEEIYASLDTINYYDLLGAHPDMKRNEIRTEYFTLSKRFHPDRAYGKVTDELRKKMAAVFRHMTQAYDILSNANSRAEYNATIASEIEIMQLERQLKAAVKAPQANKTKPAASSTSKEPPVASATKESKDSGTPQKPSLTSRPSLDPAAMERRRQWQRRRAGKAIEAIMRQSSSLPDATELLTLRLEEAAIAIEQRDYANAMRVLQEVLSIDPENKRAAELMEVSKAGKTELAVQKLLSRGKKEQSNDNPEAAQRYFENAMKRDPYNLDARHLLSHVLFEQRWELPRALTLIKEVISMGGQRARYFATLGELYLLAKQIDKAQGAFRRALALSPENKQYKKRLKACK